ncbi:MAG TPA: 2'-5' RNA ligase [Cytophagales bacterium]|nr:2'-5' RNA ligase [Cytophagales bacterium]
MSEFSGYEKMPSSVKKLGLGAAEFKALDKINWVVTEKVHGANFSFVYEEGTLRYAKRKAYLTWEDDFFGFQLVVSQLESSVLALFEVLALQYPQQKLMLYGELFGGEYPHKEVQDVPEVQAIQTGVYYAPGIHFCAFDLAMEDPELGTKRYLDYETAVGLFDEHSIFYAKPLLVGKFNEVLNFDTRINSTVPAQLGLPPLAENLIEGVVVKPYEAWDETAVSVRPIVKLKNPEFEEDKKFHEANKWSFRPEVQSKSEELAYILTELRAYVVPNRLESAISKIGAPDPSNAQRMADIEAEFLQDALADFGEDYEGLLDELAPEDQTWITERLRAEIRKVMAL